jgi:hypothetical protein
MFVFLFFTNKINASTQWLEAYHVVGAVDWAPPHIPNCGANGRILNYVLTGPWERLPFLLKALIRENVPAEPTEHTVYTVHGLRSQTTERCVSVFQKSERWNIWKWKRLFSTICSREVVLLDTSTV